MSENPLSAILPVPGSGSTSGPGKSGSVESGAAVGAIAPGSATLDKPWLAEELRILQSNFPEADWQPAGFHRWRTYDLQRDHWRYAQFTDTSHAWVICPFAAEFIEDHPQAATFIDDQLAKSLRRFLGEGRQEGHR